MAQLLVEPRRGESANRTALAGVRESSASARRACWSLYNAERELVEAEVKLIEARRDLVQASYATLASMGRLKTVALKAAATRLTGGWRTKVEASHPGAFRRYGIAPIRLRTNIVVRKTPFDRQNLTAIV